ncbi:DUF4374 domain-containing protein [Aquimarina aquimarini]|uniref:DUF4374 domain-containing protein n=1 Tax=Aquimarina aquimarini TaxID=1191734 RepID=UPI000D551759|nr:DUF4374 domain-containing protein [Aquimarina aquimarini]
MKTKKINWIKSMLLLFVISSVALSCSSDDDTTITPPDPEPISISKYVVGFQANPIGQATGVDYVLELPSLESLTTGEITVEGQGIPLKGWRFFHSVNNTIFSSGYGDDDKCIAYQLDEAGKLKEAANFTFQSTLDNYAAIDDKTLLAVELTGGVDDFTKNIPDRSFYVVNAETGLLEKVVTHAIDSRVGEGTEGSPAYIPWVTGMVLRGGKLFVSYHKLLPDNSFAPVGVDKAHVAVFKYPEFELESLIEDERTSFIGINGHSTGIEKTENGDIYSFSSSSDAAAITGATKPSGILRIKNGTTTFDPDYFFDVENAPNGGKLFWMDYVGNGKAIGRIVMDDSLGTWTVFAEQGSFFKMVVIDLINQTVTDVQGIPAHANRYTSPMFVEDGKAYLSSRVGASLASGGKIEDGETHIYIVDPETAMATKGAKVKGLTLKGIFKVSN